ncbi:MAG: type II toxin-antitoxin system ParD family antitoxin [Phycisphaerae bacterium]
MQIFLNPAVQAVVDRLVSSGRFQAADDVVREAIALLEQREHRLGLLRTMVQEGIDDFDRGDCAALDMDAIRAEGRAVGMVP